MLRPQPNSGGAQKRIRFANVLSILTLPVAEVMPMFTLLNETYKSCLFLLFAYPVFIAENGTTLQQIFAHGSS